MHRHANNGIHVAILVGLSLISASLAPAHARAQASAYNSIALEWTATGDDGDVGRASAYELRYSTSGVGSDTTTWWGNATPVPSGSLPVPSVSGATDAATVAGLSPGTTYNFIIRAVDDGGNRSGYSNVATASTLSCDAPTAAPGSFTATADTGRVDLSWSGSDPSGTATSTHVYRAAGSGSMTLRATLSAGATSYVDTSVQPGTTYSYRVAWASDCADGPSTSTETVTLPGNPPTSAASAPPAALHAYPNPSSGNVQFVVRVQGGAAQDALIRLYDLSGRWIATLVDQRLNPGEQTIVWPRTDRNGRRVSPGYYEAVGTVGDTRVRERIVLTP